MPISFDYDETRALAKQFRELTGRDIKHTQIIEAMATIKGMKADSLMHMLKHDGIEYSTVSKLSTPNQRVFFEERGLLGVLRRELELPRDPFIISYFMIGVFEVVASTSHALFEIGVMVRAVVDDLIVAPGHPNTIVGIFGTHLVIAIPNIVNIDAVPSWYDNLLKNVSHSTTIENGSRTLEYNLVGAVTDVSGSENLDKALSACKAKIPEIRERNTSSDKMHKWAVVDCD
jgi:hypothetical protein